MVRKGGFEPPRSCERQPLKLVRLPVPPLPQVEGYFPVGPVLPVDAVGPVGAVGPVDPVDPDVAGAAGVAGGVAFGAGAGPGVPVINDPGPRTPRIASASAPSMN